MSHIDLFGKDLITTQEWARDELDAVLDFSKELKRRFYAGDLPELLKNKTFFMLFYNTSTRTRSSFEAAMTYLGGHSQFIDIATTRAGEGEQPKDIAKMYERYGHGLGIRILEKAVNYEYGKGNAVLREYAKYARIPVINMADDMYHPCQGLADLMTIQEKFPKYEKKKYVIMWGYSKKVRSWCSIQEDMLLMTRYGIDVTLAFPKGYEVDKNLMAQAKINAEEAGCEFETTDDYKGALEGAHMVFPRNWASNACVSQGMNKFGEENEAKLHEKHKDWTLTQELVDKMAKNAKVLHVLPVFRGEEATDEVMDGPNSAIIDQAENRLHAQMGAMALTMGGRR